MCDVFEELPRLRTSSYYDPLGSDYKHKSILRAAAKGLQIPIRKLVFDALPIETFERGTSSASTANMAETLHDRIQEVTELRMQVIFSFPKEYKRPDLLGTDLGNLIGSMGRLNSLDLAMKTVMTDIHDHDDLANLFTPESTISYLNALESFLHCTTRNTWPCLENIRLHNMVPNLNLWRFMEKHARTLKCLSISFPLECCNEERYSCKTFLCNLRDKLYLEKFQLLIESRFGESGDERFRSYIWDKDWQPSPRNREYSADWRQEFAQPYTDAQLLEFYVTKKCPWPMENDTIAEDGLVWKRLLEWHYYGASEE